MLFTRSCQPRALSAIIHPRIILTVHSVRTVLFFAAGVHLEGPFINVKKKGAHNEAFIRGSMSPDEVERCYGDLGAVRIITLAPELPGAMETIQWLTQEKNIVVSLGMLCCSAHMLFSVGACMLCTDVQYVLMLLAQCLYVGHSMCNLETAEKAVHNGASFVTHLFNAMLPVSL